MNQESDSPNTYDDEESAELTRQHFELNRNLGALSISKAAIDQKATLEWLSGREVIATLKDRRISIVGHYGPESSLSSAIVANKHLAKDLMRLTGTPVPAGRRVSSPEDAVKAYKEIGRPIVLKPVDGSMGNGVTVNVTDLDEIRAGYARALKAGSGVLVEQYIDGSSEYRAHATSDACVAMFRRILPSVTGDGTSTIKQLVEEKNEVRKHNPTTAGYLIKMDELAKEYLRRCDLTFDYVPSAGESVAVRNVNGLTSGGDSEECLDSVGDELRLAAVKAVRGIPGMGWGGVDILVEDATQTPYVLEVNTDAAINGSTFPVYGKPRDVGSRLWQELYARSGPEVLALPAASSRIDDPCTIGSAVPGFGPGNPTLQDIVIQQLRRQSYQITMLTPQIWTAQQFGNPALWFNAVLTGIDWRISMQPIRRHLTLRQILRIAKLPRPNGRKISSMKQLQEFRKGTNNSVGLLPVKKNLGQAKNKVIQPEDVISSEVLEGKRAWFAQVRRRGLRFNVIASQYAALTVIVPSGQEPVSAEIVEEVSVMAVKAVRAVPQLGWAVVEVVRRFERDLVPGRPSATIESMSINPAFSQHSQIVAGSLDNFVRNIELRAMKSAEASLVSGDS